MEAIDVVFLAEREREGTSSAVIASEAKQSMRRRENWIASSLTLSAMTAVRAEC
jgi:hypothetical protein